MKQTQITTQAPERGLAAYNRNVDLVKVRADAEAFPRIGATPFDKAVELIRPLVYSAVLYNGQEITESRLDFVSASLVSEILNDRKLGLRSLSWYEVGMVIRDAVLGCAREMYGISVATLYSALVDYAKGEGHEAQKKANQLAQGSIDNSPAIRKAIDNFTNPF